MRTFIAGYDPEGLPAGGTTVLTILAIAGAIWLAWSALGFTVGAVLFLWSRSNGTYLTHAGFGDARRNSAFSPRADIPGSLPHAFNSGQSKARR
jgi:hypothetical protein